MLLWFGLQVQEGYGGARRGWARLAGATPLACSPGGDESGRTAAAHATASSYSSVWELSDEPEVRWKSGASLEKEVHVLGHLA